MKTTIDIAEGLFEEAKRLAERRGTTFKALVEASLRQALATEQRARARFKLRDGSFAGQGLQPGIEEGGWPLTRNLIYAERGG